MNERTRIAPELSSLERAVLDVALAPDSSINDRLRAQADAAAVTTRTPSGVGFMTKIDVPADMAIPDSTPDVTLPAVLGIHPQLPAGAEFVVQVKSGRLNTIEAFCYQGMWPTDESLFRVELRP